MRNLSDFEIEIWNQDQINDQINSIAELRISVFRTFPYLYDGNLDYEKKYLQTYIQSSQSRMIVVKKQNGLKNQLVGISSCIPLMDETDEVKAPFIKNNFEINKIFYFGESILKSEYRGLGLGHLFFDEREKVALSSRQFYTTCFCAVQRPPNHPLRPNDYKPLDVFWRQRGYEKNENITSYFSWQDVGETHETPKPMMYWFKHWKNNL